MKKLLLMATAAFGMALGVQAQTLSVPDNEVFVVLEEIGGTYNPTITVNLANAVATRDVQFDVVIPEGYEIDSYEISGVATADKDGGYAVAHSNGESVTGGTKYTFILYTTDPDNHKISINGGEVLKIELDDQRVEGYGIWEDLASGFSAAKWTNDDATEASLSTTPYTFTIGLLGDVTKDKTVDFADASVIFNYMEQEKIPSDLGGFAAIANLNGDASLDFADVSLIFGIMEANESSVKAEFTPSEVPVDVEIDWAD